MYKRETVRGGYPLHQSVIPTLLEFFSHRRYICLYNRGRLRTYTDVAEKNNVDIIREHYNSASGVKDIGNNTNPLEAESGRAKEER